MKSQSFALGLLVSLCGPLATGEEPALRLNQIQVIGSHNSYHVAPSLGVMNLLAAGGKGRIEGLDYSHLPLAEQFTDR